MHVHRKISAPAAAFLLGVFAAFFPGCAGRESNVASGNRGQVLHRGLGYEVTELDPHLVTGLAESKIINALFEGLVWPNASGPLPAPGVAERWDVSPDGLVYAFHLRSGARWSNGDPVTAQDFISSWRRILTPSLAADYASLFYVIHGAEAFHKGLTADFSSVGLAAPDERTLRITLAQPTPYFLALLTHMAWRPVHLASITASGDPHRRGTSWTRPGRIVTNGPFLLKKWTPNERIIVEKNPAYWDAGNVRLRGIHFYPIDSVDAEERAFRSGQLHVTEALPAGKAESYRRDHSPFLRIDPYLGTYFYRLNTRRPYLSDPRVRRALALAVDREAIVGKILRGGQTPARSITPPGTAGYQAPTPLGTDFPAARALLTDAGYENGRGLPPIELLYNESQNHQVIAEAVQEMWRRELGVEVRLVKQDLKSTFAARRSGDYQILRSDWVGDYVDPNTFLSIWTSDSGNNHTGWANPSFDVLIREASLTADRAKRHEALRRAEEILLETTPIIPIFHYTHPYLIQPSVRGWNPTPLDELDYRHVWLEE